MRGYIQKERNLWVSVHRNTNNELWIPKTTIALNDFMKSDLSKIIMALDNLNLNINTKFKTILFIKFDNNKEEVVNKILMK